MSNPISRSDSNKVIADLGLYFHKGKPLFVDGRLAFYKACCCNLPCNRIVWVIGIGVSAPYYTEPGSPPLRTGEGGTSYLMYYAESKDTYSVGPPGQNYWNKVWVVEFCYDEYDVKPGDEFSPDVSYANELLYWACEAYKDWVNATECLDDMEQVDNPYALSTYDDTGGIDDTYLNMDDLVGVGNWEQTRHLGPILKSNCPKCICDGSCVPDGS